MPYVTNPLTLAYGNRHYGAGPADGFGGPGYGGVNDYAGGISSIAQAALGIGRKTPGANDAYQAALAAKEQGMADQQARANAATGSISDIFSKAGAAALHANDPVVTDVGPSNSGPVAQAYLAGVPGQIAAQAPYLSPQDSKAAEDNYRFLVANQGASTGAPDYGTTALTRAVVGAGGNDSNVKGAILADQPPDQQALTAGPNDSQVKGSILQSLSPSDQRLSALGAAGEGSLSPVQVTIPGPVGPDGKPTNQTVMAAFDRRSGQISIPSQPQTQSPLALAVTGPVAAPDGSVVGTPGGAAPGAIPSVGTPPALSAPPPTPVTPPAPQPFGAPPKASATNVATPLTQDAIDAAAEKYNMTGELPSGFGGQQARQQIMNRAADMLKAKNGNVPDMIANQAGVKADRAALVQLDKTRAQISQFEGTAVKEAQLALSLAGKGLAGGGIPVINRWIQAGRTSIAGDGDVTAFNSALVSFKNEYARIMSSNGGTGGMTTDSARQEAEDLINNKMTGNQLEQTIATMAKSMKNRIDSINEEYATTQQRISGAGAPAPISAPPAANSAPQSPQAGAPPAGTILKFDAQGNRIQ